jgi:hypothetical protein
MDSFTLARINKSGCKEKLSGLYSATVAELVVSCAVFVGVLATWAYEQNTAGGFRPLGHMY